MRRDKRPVAAGRAGDFDGITRLELASGTAFLDWRSFLS